MSEDGSASRKRNGKTADPQAAARFVEELSWLLSAHSNLDFRALQKLRPEKLPVEQPSLFTRFAPKNQNVVYLVGTLPALFMDESLFLTNEDIADFALHALSIKLPRWQKKAKFELIGHIVCRATTLDDQQVAHLVRALTSIVDGKLEARQLLRSRRQQGMGWNEVIQDLLALQP